MKLFILVLFVLCCNQTVYGIEKMPAHKNKYRVVFLGDSITAGLGLEQDEAFPALIQKKADAANINIEAINAGISGDTTSGGLSRLSWYLKDKIDVLVIALGANDGMRGLSADLAKANLLEIVKLSENKYPDIKILLVGNLIPPSMGKEHFEKFKKIFPEIAKEANVPVIPFLLDGVAGISSLNLPDGIHPTAEGQKIIAETVWKDLLPILKNLPSS